MLWTILYCIAFGALVIVVESRHFRMRSTWEALTKALGRAESMEIEAWVPKSVPVGKGREQRREIMRRFGMTMTILAALVLWYAYVVPPVRGDDVQTAAAYEEEEVPVGALLLSTAEASERAEEAAAMEAAVLEDEAPDGEVREALPIGEPVPAVEAEAEPPLPMPEGGPATITILEDAAPEDELPPAIPDPESDATAEEVMSATGTLLQAIKDKDALAITLGAFFVLFAVFRLRPVRDGLGKWISPGWYRVIPIGLAVVLGILVAIAVGGDVVGSLVKGLAGGGGIAVVYAAITKASAKKDEAADDG